MHFPSIKNAVYYSTVIRVMAVCRSHMFSPFSASKTPTFPPVFASSCGNLSAVTFETDLHQAGVAIRKWPSMVDLPMKRCDFLY